MIDSPFIFATDSTKVICSVQDPFCGFDRTYNMEVGLCIGGEGATCISSFNCAQGLTCDFATRICHGSTGSPSLPSFPYYLVIRILIHIHMIRGVRAINIPKYTLTNTQFFSSKLHSFFCHSTTLEYS